MKRKLPMEDTERPPIDPDVKARELFEKGVVVLPLLQDSLTVADVQTAFQTAKKRMPEFKPEVYEQDRPMSLGGFGALNNPSSFHQPEIIDLRRSIYQAARRKLLAPFMQLFVSTAAAGTPYAPEFENGRLGKDGLWNTQLLLDRLMWRYPGQKPMNESWHRDVVASTLNGVPTGAQPNLSDHPQHFSCVPGSHFFKVGDIAPARLLDISDSGFATIKNASDKAYCQAHRVIVTIPPLQSVVFFQHLIHEVTSTAVDHVQQRLFHGIRLTPSGSDLLFETQYREQRTFEDHGPGLLPSGQSPRMYSRNHGSSFLGAFTLGEWKCKETYEQLCQDHNGHMTPTEAVAAAQNGYATYLDRHTAAPKPGQKRKQAPPNYAQKAIQAFEASGYGPGTLQHFQAQPEWHQSAFTSQATNGRLKPKFRVHPRAPHATNVPFWCQETFSPAVQATFLEKTHGGTGLRFQMAPPVLPSLAAMGIPLTTRPDGSPLYGDGVAFEMKLHPLRTRTE